MSAFNWSISLVDEELEDDAPPPAPPPPARLLDFVEDVVEPEDDEAVLDDVSVEVLPEAVVVVAAAVDALVLAGVDVAVPPVVFGPSAAAVTEEVDCICMVSGNSR
jgi:hypothetical protein